ncbi:hypothetical protein CYMTET_51842 [Cymbomonas tetramitiformis]|uniref:Uncharacterized protein n=1 Tax=Cymbomonas tetramitiformis TaxID=36881 RepID=A0AAE0BKA2_9CHLO|nr:hypothetical protein CYMTET_51842 [Cymbomonas tetramitiformis]
MRSLQALSWKLILALLAATMRSLQALSWKLILALLAAKMRSLQALSWKLILALLAATQTHCWGIFVQDAMVEHRWRPVLLPQLYSTCNLPRDLRTGANGVPSAALSPAPQRRDLPCPDPREGCWPCRVCAKRGEFPIGPRVVVQVTSNLGLEGWLLPVRRLAKFTGLRQSVHLAPPEPEGKVAHLYCGNLTAVATLSRYLHVENSRTDAADEAPLVPAGPAQHRVARQVHSQRGGTGGLYQSEDLNDWRLTRCWFEWADKQWEIFASEISAQLPRYYRASAERPVLRGCGRAVGGGRATGCAVPYWPEQPSVRELEAQAEDIQAALALVTLGRADTGMALLRDNRSSMDDELSVVSLHDSGRRRRLLKRRLASPWKGVQQLKELLEHWEQQRD